MKDFKKYFTIPATPENVYIALTNPLTIQLWTGSPAEMSTEVGADFSIFDENIVGKNLEFVPNEKIVQQWYFEGEAEESIVTLKLHPSGNNTSLEVRHTNIPDEAFTDISEGWTDMYMSSLIEFYSEV